MSSIVTFYSFKGGVGRTMALANVATLLAQRGRRVLAVDWDLEAPGLHRYFEDRAAPQRQGGLLDLLEDASRGGPHSARWQDHVVPVRLPGIKGSLDLLAAGSHEGYAGRLQQFDWERFFTQHNGGSFVELLRDEWRRDYDITLVDSRTGYTDSGGVCTIQLPDVLVAVFTANEQSLRGIEEAIGKAQAGRQGLEIDRGPLVVLPLPSRFDGRVEVEEAERWTREFTERLAPYYDDWLPSGTKYRRVVERTRVPHVPYFTFGERLPALVQSPTDPETMSYVYDVVAELLDRDFKNADEILGGKTADLDRDRRDDELVRLAEDLERRVEQRIKGQRRLLVARRVVLVLAALASAVGVAVALPEPWLGGVLSAVAAVLVSESIILRGADTKPLRAEHARLRLALVDRDRPGELRAAYEAAEAALLDHPRSASGSG